MDMNLRDLHVHIFNAKSVRLVYQRPNFFFIFTYRLFGRVERGVFFPFIATHAFALQGRKLGTDDHTQDAALLCPGLRAGCPLQGTLNSAPSQQ